MRAPRFTLVAAPLACVLLAAPLAVGPAAPARAQYGAGVSITLAPPVLPIYVQPPLPAPGYIWTPGYWDYAADGGYYWVPGTWVQPPAVGLLWTPGYWGFSNGLYVFNRGYWGPHVGYYGGVNYGFGYTGTGFFGGEWRGNAFAYNRAVNNFGGVHVTNVYERNVTEITTNRASFNGPNGVTARPSPEEASFAREQHMQPTGLQQQHERAAAQNPGLLATVNHGAPAVAATARAAEFRGPGVVPARPGAAPLGQPAGVGRMGQPQATFTHMHPMIPPGAPSGPAGMPPGHPGLRGPTPVRHGPAMPQERFNVTAPSAPRPPAAPHPGAAPRPAGEGERHR